MMPTRRTRRMTLGLMLGLSLLGLAAAVADDNVNLIGTWTWSWKGPQGEMHRHVLEVEGRGRRLAARERVDDMQPVRVADLKVVGKKVNFSVRRDDRVATYFGTLD